MGDEGGIVKESMYLGEVDRPGHPEIQDGSEDESL
jgi:hypothetical protein